MCKNNYYTEWTENKQSFTEILKKSQALQYKGPDSYRDAHLVARRNSKAIKFVLNFVFSALHLLCALCVKRLLLNGI